MGFWPKKFRLEKDASIHLIAPNKVAITGYFYHFIQNQTLGAPMDVWYPTDLENARFDYSIYIKDPVNGLGFSPIGFDFPCDSTITILDEEAALEEMEQVKLEVYPNPFDESVNILAPSDIQTINLYDLAGKLCEIVYLSNSNRCTIQTSQLAAGAYILDVMLLDGTKLKTKIVKL
jgi:hypothetical protein